MKKFNIVIYSDIKLSMEWSTYYYLLSGIKKKYFVSSLRDILVDTKEER